MNQKTRNITLIFVLVCISNYKSIKADLLDKGLLQTETRFGSIGGSFEYINPPECFLLLDEFADTASNFTKCSIKHARPVRLCENCIDHYVRFRDKYQKLLNSTINGTSCRDIFISQDRLDVVLDYYENIMTVWDKGNCNGCYVWFNSTPVISNDTVKFYEIYKNTMECINTTQNNPQKNYTEVCEKCMENYILLNNFYESLSTDPLGLDTTCMDVVDSMNATRFKWSKELGCCKLRKSPEIIFLYCSSIIAALPIFFYIVVRYCGPIRDLPSVLKQSRFNQKFLRNVNGRIN